MPTKEPSPACQGETEVPGGIYVHIPFCMRKCPYCDFYSITDLELLPVYLNALHAEIRLTAAENNFPCDTLYLGGGTPSLLGPEALQRLIQEIRCRHPLPENAEITLEVNPGSMSPETLKAFRQAGINRLSIGVQSFSDARLQFLGRIHSAEQAHATIQAARAAGFDNLGLDLIYGLPDQTAGDWAEDLEQATAYGPEHLSCYILSYEPGLPLTRKLHSRLFTPLPNEAVAALFEQTIAFLSTKGYEHYEISNFAAQTGLRSRHNQKYWTFAPYLGLGPSAHSHQDGRRRWNHRSLSRYLSDLAAGRLPLETEEILSHQQQILEAVFLGLRQSRGIDLGWFDKKFKMNFQEVFAETIQRLHQEGFLQVTAGHCRLTTTGKLVLDGIVDLFVAGL